MAQQDYARLLESVFESAIDGILVIDARGTIKMANAAAADLFGYTEAAMLGQNVSTLMGADHAHRHDGYLERYLRTGEARIIGVGREVEGKRRDGSKFPFRLSVGELRLPDETLFTGIVHDRSAEHAYQQELASLNATLERRVTSRTIALEEAAELLNREIETRRAAEREAAESREEALVALERERELGELKSRFVSLASHEFRTPLATILSSAELLKRYTEAHQQDRRERHIARIRKAVIHLTDVLNDFLSLGRMDEGRITPTPEEVDLAVEVREFVEYITPTLKPGQSVLLTSPRAERAFRTDRRFLQNILTNLVSNASKYSPRDGQIQLKVAVEPAPRALRIEVVDKGIGIPAEEQDRLFARFFRAQNAENIQGTGLGLHIVSRYVRMLGGEIWFESVEGEGSHFYVRLPEAALA